MYETVLRTEDLIKTHVPVELLSEYASDFRVTDRVLTLGSVAVRSMHAPPVTVRRTRKLVRQADPEVYLVSLLCQGSMEAAAIRLVGTLKAGARMKSPNRAGAGSIRILSSFLLPDERLK
ncbi:hypothetical protein [Streptomyces sp. NPDC050548]|uniref:hypothetical protein n=1 Tax=Streptomyces sp. NPDC050548 TaxID=3365629 RepID=UPI00379DFE8F